ncbi:transposase [Iodobacter sp.]|uniref:transposase n=1 Tax=Iodobacter sp. TaxID=1915058 RepID=UPI0025D3BCC4|nr:transposase [Iodobacter sp.]
MHSEELAQASRLQATAFTRQRKLPFPLLLSTILACMSSNVHAELMAFFAKAFTLLNQRLLQQTTTFTPRWQGLRLVAADASFLCLPARQIGSTQKLNAAAFALYLPGAELTLSAELYLPSVGERQMLFEHLEHVQADDLLLLEGYPSRWLAAVLSQRQRYFCIRVDQWSYTAAKTLLRSEQTELIATLSAPNKQDALDYECQRIPTQVRFVKTICPNGTIRVVMTNLLDTERYPAAVFSGLYHQRWRIEEAFKRLKHRLHLESVTGDNWLAAQQDFGAKIVADNLHSLCVATSATMLPAPVENGCCYKINRAIALSILKRCLPAVLLKKPRAITRLKLALNELCKAVIYFDPHAKKDRPKHPKPHDFTAYKSGV